MNFNELYTRVILKEEVDERDVDINKTPTMPTPDNYDVEPLPIPNTSRDIEELSTYVQDINTFLNKINGIEGRSLHQFVNDVDRDGSILEGISDTSSDITKLAELAASLTQTLHSYMTGVNKRRRELAAINNTPR